MKEMRETVENSDLELLVVVYYNKSINQDLYRRTIYDCRYDENLYRRTIYDCRYDERLKTKPKGSTRLVYTGFLGGMELPKI
jgi:hypothetical protein